MGGKGEGGLRWRTKRGRDKDVVDGERDKNKIQK